MRRVTSRLVWRSAAAHRSRVMLAVAATVLSMAFVCGSLILAEGAHASYGRLVHGLTAGVDVYVRGPEVDTGNGISDFTPLPSSLVASIAHVPGVTEATGVVARLGQLVSPSGRFLGSGTSTYAYSWPADTGLVPFTISAGHPPERPGEVVLDAASARSFGLGIGDSIRVSLSTRTPQPSRVVGLAIPREGGDLSGAAAVFVTGPWAQRVLGIGNSWDLIEVRAAHGLAPDTVRARIAAVLPHDGSAAITSREFAGGQLAQLARRAGSVTTILVLLSILALVVGAGIVRNTFTIVSTQRGRELGLLRVVGMTRAELSAVIVGEAMLLGLVASFSGAALGVPAAALLRDAVRRLGTAPPPPVHVDWWVPITVAAGGTLLTVGLATSPARRAAALSPVAGLRAARQPRAAATTPVWIPVSLLALGACALGVAAVTGAAAAWIAGGVLVVVGLVGCLPWCSAPVLGHLGATAARTGAAGAVAAATMRREPHRATAPALALVLGLGAVCAVSVVAATAHASVATLVRRADRSDLVLVSDASPGIDPEAVERTRNAPAVMAVAEIGTDSFLLNGRPAQLTAIDTDFFAQTIDLHVVEGTLSGFADGDVAVTRSAAHGRHVGGLVGVQFAQPWRRALRIAAIIEDNGITRDWIIPFETYRIGYQAATIRSAFVRAAPGVTAGELRRQVAVGISGFPGIRVDDPAAYADAQGKDAEGPVALIEALGGLAVAIAVLGVMNALSLAVVERAPELGLLASLGMTPGQISLAVQWEAALIATLGSVFGIAAGLVAGLSLVSAVQSHGFTQVAVPVPLIAAAAGVVVAASFIAAAVPARRAVGIGEASALDF